MSLTRTLAFASALALVAPTVALASPSASTAATEVVSTTHRAPAPATDTTGYAQREQRDTQVADYQGGSTIVIGISGGALLVILLILLLI